MPQCTADAGRLDPYKNFRFRVRWDGRYISGVSKISAPMRVTEVLPPRSGFWGRLFGALLKRPGKTRYESIVMQRGRSEDQEFEKWAAMTLAFVPSVRRGPANDLRKDIVIEVCDEAGQKAVAYRLCHCWVSRYQPISELDALASAVLMEEITVEYEGWARESEAGGPAPTTSDEPTRR